MKTHSKNPHPGLPPEPILLPPDILFLQQQHSIFSHIRKGIYNRIAVERLFHCTISSPRFQWIPALLLNNLKKRHDRGHPAFCKNRPKPAGILLRETEDASSPSPFITGGDHTACHQNDRRDTKKQKRFCRNRSPCSRCL